jgi:hypothetical protein
MKHTILFLLLLCTAAFAVERPKGFLGINWGASPEEAKRVMQARQGVKFSEEADDYKFEITGGTFAGQPVAKWVLEFPGRQFTSAIVTLKNEGNASTLYKDFRTQFAAKYGPATTDKKITPKADKRPVHNPGAVEVKPQLGGIAIWKFGPNMKEKSNITISCQLADAKGGPAMNEDQLVLTIHYEKNTGTETKDATGGAKPSQNNVKKEDL